LNRSFGFVWGGIENLKKRKSMKSVIAFWSGQKTSKINWGKNKLFLMLLWMHLRNKMKTKKLDNFLCAKTFKELKQKLFFYLNKFLS
jgi:hypothetical protein